MAEKGNIVDLCKEALKKLADSGDPFTLIEDAIKTGNKIAKEKNIGTAAYHGPSHGKKIAFSRIYHDVTKHKGWTIIQSGWLDDYALVDPEGLVRAQNWEPKSKNPHFQLFLEVLIELAPKYPPPPRTMFIYQLVTNEKVYANKDCDEVLTVEKANERFPNSKNLASGFFTDHPGDKTAIVPVLNYFANIALNRDDECVVLLGNMGAKSVEITTVDESKTKDTTGFKVRLKKDEVNGESENENTIDEEADFKTINAKVGVSIRSELKNFNKLIVKFEGRVSESDISPDILQNSVWFKGDAQMNAILEGRRLKNKLTEYDIITKNEQTFNFDFRAAANVLDKLESSLRNDFETAKNQTRKFHVIFGE